MTELFDVLGLDPSDSVVRAVAFALPIAVLITLLALLVVMSKRKAKKRRAALSVPQPADREIGGDQPIADETASIADGVPTQREAAHVALVRNEAAARVATGRIEAGRIEAGRIEAEHVESAPIRPVAGSAPAAPQANLEQKSVTAGTAPGTAVASVEAQIQAMTDAEQKGALSPLYLQLAVAHRAAGDDAACLAALRAAAGFGALHGPRGAHAIARLELGEIALKDGDPIGACEQWQIARLAFHDDGQKDAFHRVDKRMRDNGCPTDWVLTDF